LWLGLRISRSKSGLSNPAPPGECRSIGPGAPKEDRLGERCWCCEGWRGGRRAASLWCSCSRASWQLMPSCLGQRQSTQNTCSHDGQEEQPWAGVAHSAYKRQWHLGHAQTRGFDHSANWRYRSLSAAPGRKRIAMSGSQTARHSGSKHVGSLPVQIWDFALAWAQVKQHACTPQKLSRVSADSGSRHRGHERRNTGVMEPLDWLRRSGLCKDCGG